MPIARGKHATVRATADDGSEKTFEVTVRIDTPQELEYYRNGGILPYVSAPSRNRRKDGTRALTTQASIHSCFDELSLVKTTSPRIVNSGAQGRGWEGVQGFFLLK